MEAELSEETDGDANEPSEASETAGDGGSRNDTETVSISVDGEEVAVSIPADADDSEAAAIATAVGAHLHDRAVAAATAAGEDDGPDPADEWKLAGRMKSMGRRRWPDDVRRGEEWKAAARSFY
jgi:hypothetical protein